VYISAWTVNTPWAVLSTRKLWLSTIASPFPEALIEAAVHFIYIENQYFTSHRVGRALAGRLEDDEGPEVIVVMPEKTGGCLEQHSMDVLRARLIRDLRARPIIIIACVFSMSDSGRNRMFRLWCPIPRCWIRKNPSN
jgi:hypothetical protein